MTIQSCIKIWPFRPPVRGLRAFAAIYAGWGTSEPFFRTEAWLAENLRCWDPDLDHFHTVTDTGLLPSGELDAVADAVWGNTSVSRGTQNDR
jgi:hypothetical protein